MPSVINTQTIGASDLCIVMNNSQFGRAHGYGDTWNSLRIALLFSAGPDNVQSITGNVFRVGLCNGTVNMPGDVTTNNSYGVNFFGTWARGTYGWNMSNSAFRRVGSTETLSATNISPRLSFQGVSRYPLFIDIVKGSPNYTFNFWYHSGNGTADMTPASFFGYLNIPGTYLSYTDTTYGAPTGTSLAIDTATNGILDTVYCGWSATTWSLWISYIAVVRLS